jgi:hypothetical protein
VFISHDAAGYGGDALVIPEFSTALYALHKYFDCLHRVISGIHLHTEVVTLLLKETVLNACR